MLIDRFDTIKGDINFYEGINGRDEYLQSVVLLLLISTLGEYHFVFQQRAASVRQGNEICFPGGKIDSRDKQLVDTALRETEEELGIDRKQINILTRLDTVIAPMGAIVDAFLATTTSNIEDIRIHKEEVERVFTIPLSWFMENDPEKYSVLVQVHATELDQKNGGEIILLPIEELGLPTRYKTPWGNFKQTMYVYKTPHGIIWGLTARLIYDCCNKIKKLT